MLFKVASKQQPATVKTTNRSLKGEKTAFIELFLCGLPAKAKHRVE